MGTESNRPASRNKKAPPASTSSTSIPTLQPSAPSGTPPSGSSRSPIPPSGAAAKKKGADPRKKGGKDGDRDDEGAHALNACDEQGAEPVVQIDPAAADAARRSYAWRDLTEDHLERLAATQSTAEIATFLAETFSIAAPEVDLQDSILLDYYIYPIIFSRDHSLDGEQTSALFSIMKVIRERAIDNNWSFDDTFQYFKDLVVKHSMVGENSTRLFSPEIAKDIVIFVTSSFFQHFDLYKYCFTKTQEEEHHCIEHQIETPMAPMPLALALTEAAYLEKVEQERLTRERLEREEMERRERMAAEEAAAQELAREAAKRKAIEQQANAVIEGTIDMIKRDVNRMLESEQKILASKIESLDSRVESKLESADLDSNRPKSRPATRK